MIELGYRYCDLDKTHEYSVMSIAEADSWNKWLWHWLKFDHTETTTRLVPYHANWDNQVKILARYRGASAKTVAGHISKKIEQHRRRKKNRS